VRRSVELALHHLGRVELGDGDRHPVPVVERVGVDRPAQLAELAGGEDALSEHVEHERDGVALDLARLERDAVVGIAEIAVEAVAVVVEDAEPPVVAHAPEEDLAQLRVDPAPDALDLHGVGEPRRRERAQGSEGIQDRIGLRIGPEEHVVEDVHLRVDGEVLADLEGRLEAETHVRHRERVVPAFADEGRHEDRVARLIGAAPQIEIVHELAAQAQVAVGLEDVDALP